MNKNRMEAFSDGVIAVIITIMVLEMKAPHDANLISLKPLVPVFISYVLSFIYWDILEQSSSSFASYPKCQWKNIVGQFTFIVLAISRSFFNIVDG